MPYTEGMPAKGWPRQGAAAGAFMPIGYRQPGRRLGAAFCKRGKAAAWAHFDF